LLEDQNPVRRSEILAGTGSATLALTEAIKSLSNVSGREAEVRERDSSIDDFMLRVKPQVMELLPEKVVFFRLRSFERNCSCYKIEEPNFLAFKK
ncbi:hypothetical protein KMY63_24670, partial [Klebsiella pneumoniae]|uniref:hypothetical protein n=2 Tax=Klebsiella pneumoniae TaxID=573 RepID=UPI0020050236